MVATTMKSLDATYSGNDYNINWHVETPDLTLVKSANMDVGNDIKGQLKGVRSIKFYPDPNANVNTLPGNICRYCVWRIYIKLDESGRILRGATATTVINSELQTAP